MAALTDLTIAQLAAAMAKKEASAVEVADTHLAKLDEHRALNVFITETPEKAREMANASDARRAAGAAGLLEGVPRAIKRLFCTVGMKPPYGRCSRWGVVAFASSLDQPGPLARTVEDSALLLQAMAGHDPKDSTSAPLAVPDFVAAARNPDIKGLRVGIPREYHA